MPAKINYFYYISFFVISFISSIWIIRIHINSISFWIRYNIIINGINSIELNIMIIDYESLSKQIRLIVIFIGSMVFFPFFVTYCYIKTASSIEKQYYFHWFYYGYCIVYIQVVTEIFNHYDFAYSTILDIIIPTIVQKCVDFSVFFIQYKGYYYDFFWIFLIYTRLIIQLFRFPVNSAFIINSNKAYLDFIKVIVLRVINIIYLIYYFGSYSFMINLFITITGIFYIECILVMVRSFNIIHRIKLNCISLFV